MLNHLDIDQPELRLIGGFWRNLLDDLSGRGCTSDNVPTAYRRLPYKKRVTIEREILQDQAEKFIESPEFEMWARFSGLKPEQLKEKLWESSRTSTT